MSRLIVWRVPRHLSGAYMRDIRGVPFDQRELLPRRSWWRRLLQWWRS